MRHLLSAGDLSRDEAELVLTTAAELRSLADRPIKKLPALRGRTVVNLFFEDSTRTRSSFEIAGKWLSADVINVSGKGSSASKGVWSSPTRRPSRLVGSSRPRRSSQRQIDWIGCRNSARRPRRIRSSSSASSPRIVLPACLEAQVANVHQFAPTPVRRATACASRQ